MSLVRSASRVGPKSRHTLSGLVTPTSSPAMRAFLRASLMTPRSAPSTRLMWVYHWYFWRSVRIACCGLGIASSTPLGPLGPGHDFLARLAPKCERATAVRLAQIGGNREGWPADEGKGAWE